MESLLFKAIRRKDEKSVADLLTQVSNYNVKDCNENTPLNVAAHYDNVRILKTLVNSGADVNSKNNFGYTPLHSALLCSETFDAAFYLISQGADVSAKDNRGITPFEYCLEKPSGGKFLDYLVESGTKVEIFEDGHNLLEAIFRCTGKRTDILEWLLKNGALDFYGTPFPTSFVKSYSSNRDAMELLLKYGCDVNVPFPDNSNILDNCSGASFRVVLKHIAVLETLGNRVSPSLIQTISNRRCFTEYTRCREELCKAKLINIPKSLVRFFNLLVADEFELGKYAVNKDLVKGFSKIDWAAQFPIYGATMKKNLSEAVKIREFSEKAAVSLNSYWPEFYPTNLIIKDIIDCSTKDDWKKLGF